MTPAGTNCPKCGNSSKRFGRHANGLQRYRCLACKKTSPRTMRAVLPCIEDYLTDPRGLTAIQLLLEGCSIRTAERMTGIRPASICKLLTIAGDRCEKLTATLIQNVPATEVQADEAWSFIAKKEKNKGPEEAHNDTIGDCYVWVCLERNTKLVLSYSVGRTLAHAMDLMLKPAALLHSDQRFPANDGRPTRLRGRRRDDRGPLRLRAISKALRSTLPQRNAAIHRPNTSVLFASRLVAIRSASASLPAHRTLQFDSSHGHPTHDAINERL